MERDLEYLINILLSEIPKIALKLTAPGVHCKNSNNCLSKMSVKTLEDLTC